MQMIPKFKVGDCVLLDFMNQPNLTVKIVIPIIGHTTKYVVVNENGSWSCYEEEMSIDKHGRRKKIIDEL